MPWNGDIRSIYRFMSDDIIAIYSLDMKQKQITANHTDYHL